MTVTAEQRAYARIAGILILLKYVLEGTGDYWTIMARAGESFAETARYAAGSPVLWRFCLLNVGLAWMVITLQGFALYVVLEPVNKRLAQLALALRLGASFVGAASLMFRVAEGYLYKASEAGLFTTEQLSKLASVSTRGAGAGVTTSWMFLGSSSMLFFLLFLRSRTIPGAIARLGMFGSPLLVVASAVMFVYPPYVGWLKAFGLPGLFAEVAAAVWLLAKGLPPRETPEAPG